MIRIRINPQNIFPRWCLANLWHHYPFLCVYVLELPIYSADQESELIKMFPLLGRLRMAVLPSTLFGGSLPHTIDILASALFMEEYEH